VPGATFFSRHWIKVQMSYLVLARKYRPQTFDEIVGQEHVTRTLQNAIRQGRLHHAFLFTGARGVGKTTAARILAKALSCDQAPTPTPCNQCEACREIAAGTSVDVQEIDAASNNGVDNIRDLREAIRYAPVRGKKKVYILDEVHMLSTGAWNALLKTLEEPPPHAVFVFATTDPHKLPATILSRVQRYDFKLVPSRRIVEHLASVLDAEKLRYEPGALMLVARESGGSVRDSLSLLDQVIASPGANETLGEKQVAEILGVADRALLTDLGRAVVGKDAGAALAVVDAAFTRGYDLPQLAQSFLGHLRDLVVIASVKDPAPLIDASAAELEELRAQAGTAGAGLPELLFGRFAKIAEEVSKSPLPRYVLEVGLVELTRVEPLEPLSGLLQKLSELEARLESGAPPPSRSAPPRPAAQTPTEARGESRAPAPRLAEAQPRKAPESFTELIEALLENQPLLSELAQAKLLSWEESHLRLSFASEFVAGQLKDKLAQLRAALKTLLGRDLAVEIVVGPIGDESAPTESLLEVEQRKVDEDRERRKREALEHPARKILDEKFGGTWKEPVVDNLEKDNG
jgi:DNA polymerase III subunit gamma/tau